ncbi:neuropilin and tolloid-like isoform X2 [Lycorma delicatula]
MEPSEGCKFDYLEVRDGAHGYSSQIGLFCGRDFPPMLTSSDKNLWLHFHSDENIEYSGFRAVYTMIPKPTPPSGTLQPELDTCQFRTGGSEGFVNSSDIDPERIRLSTVHNLQLDCMWTIEVEEGWRIQLQWEKFNLLRPNDCEANFIDIFPERTDLPSRMNNFCGSIAELVQSPGNILHIRFLAEAKAVNSTFSALFTAFRERQAGCDEEKEYDCEDGTCISIDLVCNDRANCRFRWDEDECGPKDDKLSEHMLIILTIFFLILTGMCFAFLFNCFRKLVRDHRIIQAQLRESRESRLEQLGRKTPAATVMTPLATVLSNSGGGTGSQSIRSVSPPRLRGTATSMTTIPGATPARSDCYVPTAASSDILPIVVKEKSQPSACSSSQDNGEAVFLKRGDSTSADVDDVDNFLLPEDIHFPEMRDNECQTRESLFHNPSYTPNSSSSATPPPPPPPASRHPTRSPLAATEQQTSSFRPSADSRSTPGGSFTTFGYGRNKPHVPEQRFRAEAVIQMDKYAPGDPRPYSVDSTKSAPDVIVTH